MRSIPLSSLNRTHSSPATPQQQYQPYLQRFTATTHPLASAHAPKRTMLSVLIPSMFALLAALASLKTLPTAVANTLDNKLSCETDRQIAKSLSPQPLTEHDLPKSCPWDWFNFHSTLGGMSLLAGLTGLAVASRNQRQYASQNPGKHNEPEM